MRHRLLFLPLVLALLLLAVFGTGLQCVLGTVSHVVDGDTFDVVADLPIGYGDDCPVTAGQMAYYKDCFVNARGCPDAKR